MKLIIRKVDSATSLLVFIYRFNKFFTKTPEAGLKLSSILRTLKLFGKNEGAIRMSLSRALKSGLFEHQKIANEVYYYPTPAGRQFIGRWEKDSECFLKRLQLRSTPWDKQWHFINIMDSKDFKTEGKKAALHEGLVRLGFTQLGTDTWVSPYNLSDELGLLIAELKCERHIMKIHGDMEAPGDLAEFITQLYQLNQLITPYKNFTNIYQGNLNELKNSLSKKDIPDNQFLIPLFYNLGRDFFDIAFNDPMLPKGLLPEWEGDIAAAILMQCMEILMPLVNEYFNSIEQAIAKKEVNNEV